MLKFKQIFINNQEIICRPVYLSSICAEKIILGKAHTESDI